MDQTDALHIRDAHDDERDALRDVTLAAYQEYAAILPEPMGSKGIFKVALGARAGPTRDGIVELFDSLAAYPGMQSLRRTFAPAMPSWARTARR